MKPLVFAIILSRIHLPGSVAACVKLLNTAPVVPGMFAEMSYVLTTEYLPVMSSGTADEPEPEPEPSPEPEPEPVPSGALVASAAQPAAAEPSASTKRRL